MNKTNSKIHFCFIVVLVCYFLLHTITRILISDAVQIDEAEQVLLSQLSYQWGYGSEPPLYTWLQIVFFSIFTNKIVALALFKNTLLFFSYLFTYLIAKHILKDPIKAIVCCCSLIFIPSISWEAQRDLTHSIILFTLASCTLLTLFKFLENPKTYYYILVGMLVGLGCLSKYTYGIFAFVLFGSWLLFENFRKLIFSKKFTLSIFLTLLIILPHFIWFYTNYINVSFHEKLNHNSGYSFFHSIAQMYNVVQAAFLFSLPFSGIYILLFGKYFLQKKSPCNKNLNARMLGIFLVTSVVFFICLVAVLNVTKFKQRWFIPFLFCFPIYLFVILDNITDKWHEKIRDYLFFAGVSALLIYSALFGRILFASYTKKYNKLNKSYSEIALQLKQYNIEKGVVLAEEQLIAANLKLHFPEIKAICPKIHFPIASAKTFLIIWESQNLPPQFDAFIRNHIPNFSTKEMQTITVKYKYSEDYLTLYFVLWKNEF